MADVAKPGLPASPNSYRNFLPTASEPFFFFFFYTDFGLMTDFEISVTCLFLLTNLITRRDANLRGVFQVA